MLNNVILMGRMTADAELKATPSGKSVTTFSIAVERDYSQNGERQTDFINLVAWGKTAEFITNYFGKGNMIAVRGSIQTRQYEKDGSKRTATEVLVDKVSFCGEKTERREEPKIDADPFVPLTDDDLPF